MMNALSLTGTDYIDAVNEALKEASLSVRVRTFVSGHQLGIYSTDRLVTTRGSHVMVSLYRNPDCGVYLKSVCKVRNKHQVAAVLINKQAGTNTRDLAWFDDLEGPVLNPLAMAG